MEGVEPSWPVAAGFWGRCVSRSRHIRKVRTRGLVLQSVRLPRSSGVAAALTAAFNALSERGEGRRAKPKSAADLAAAIDPVFTFLRGGLDALKD